jgi:hypothetical protein
MDDFLASQDLLTVNSRLTVNHYIDFNPILTVHVQHEHREYLSHNREQKLWLFGESCVN